jgi:HD-GYP domain-containing protein (c-di-GMP phosphodiesterase class II)
LGKIAVPDTILNKPSILNNAEQVLVESHPVIGADLIAKIDALAHLVPIIRHHHERYDGTGYPDGLKGEDIPLFARILAVADSFEAMTAERAYRSGLSEEEAAAELKAGAGTQWDPAVIEVFLEVLEEQERQDT